MDFTRYQIILTSGSYVGKLDEAEEIKKQELPIVPDAQMCEELIMKYTKCPDPLSLLGKAFGEIKINKDTASTPAEISRFQIKKYEQFQSIIPISDDRAWVVNIDYENNTLTKQCSLIDNTGQVHNKLTLPEQLIYLSMHPQTNDLYGSFTDNTIRQITPSDGKTSIVFISRRCRPSRFTFTPEGHVIGGRILGGTVYIYSPEGRVIYQSDTLHNVYHISVCPRTENIALACGKDGVVVMNSSLSKIHLTYKGRASTPGQSREPFKAYTDVYDTHGNLLVADFDNEEIHDLVDGTDGTFIKVIHAQGLSKQLEMAFVNDILWIGCDRPLKVICLNMK